MIETNYDNGTIVVTRNGKEEYVFELADFVSAAQVEPLQDKAFEMQKYEEGKKKISREELKKLDRDWFEMVINTGIKEPISYDKAKETMTTNEIRELVKEVFVFLLGWSSTEEAKRYSEQLAEIQKNENKQSKTSHK